MNRDWTIFGLKDQIAIVTGASQGIGRTLAIALAQAGADIALVSRTRSDLEAVAKEIEAAGRKALVIPADIQEVSQIRKLVDAVHTTFGRIDILINNAAWTATVEALEATEEEWDQTIDSSLKSVFFLCQAWRLSNCGSISKGPRGTKSSFQLKGPWSILPDFQF